MMMRFSKRTMGLFIVELFLFMNEPTQVAGQTLNCILDIAVVVDMAGNHGDVADFIQQLSVQVDISEEGSHIGLVDAGDTAGSLLSLTEGLSTEAIATAFASVQNGDGNFGDLSLNLNSAIQKAYDEILSRPDNREDVSDVILVISDGQGDIGGCIPTATAIVAVGVGAEVELSSLNQVDSTGVAFHVETSAQLTAIAGDVNIALCQAQPRSEERFLCNPFIIPNSMRWTEFEGEIVEGSCEVRVFQECSCIVNELGKIVLEDGKVCLSGSCSTTGCLLILGGVKDPDVTSKPLPTSVCEKRRAAQG